MSKGDYQFSIAWSRSWTYPWHLPIRFRTSPSPPAEQKNTWLHNSVWWSDLLAAGTFSQAFLFDDL